MLDIQLTDVTLDHPIMNFILALARGPRAWEKILPSKKSVLCGTTKLYNFDVFKINPMDTILPVWAATLRQLFRY